MQWINCAVCVSSHKPSPVFVLPSILSNGNKIKMGQREGYEQRCSKQSCTTGQAGMWCFMRSKSRQKINETHLTMIGSKVWECFLD